MSRWIVVAALALQAHFAVSYLVPLDAAAQRTFGGLLRWAWPWSIGDGGPLGRMTAEGFPLAGFFIAVTAGSALVIAALGLARVWVPFEWWRPLASAGAALSLLLMVLFFAPTKLLPILTALVILYLALGFSSATAPAA
jgi:hypothetical protein